MPTNLTDFTIASTYNQLLHVDGGLSSTEKTVYSGDGIATALKIGTSSVSVDNIQLDGNTIYSTNTDGDLILAPNGTGVVNISNANISSANISNANISNANISSFLIGDNSAGISFNNTTLTAVGTNTDIDINIVPKGAGKTRITNLEMVDGTVSFNVIQRSYAVFSSSANQHLFSTPIGFDTTEIATSDITLVSDNNSNNKTKIVFATTGVYKIIVNIRCKFYSSGGHSVHNYSSVWFSINGNSVPRSTFDSLLNMTSSTLRSDIVTVIASLQAMLCKNITAGQYLQIFGNIANGHIYYEGPSGSIPAKPSAYVMIERIG